MEELKPFAAAKEAKSGQDARGATAVHTGSSETRRSTGAVASLRRGRRGTGFRVVTDWVVTLVAVLGLDFVSLN